jgi:hypothetical protein
MENLVPIGRFSKMTRLTIKTLRRYDELGLLAPAIVDPSSGYRYYRNGANRARRSRSPTARPLLHADPQSSRPTVRARRQAPPAAPPEHLRPSSTSAGGCSRSSDVSSSARRCDAVRRPGEDRAVARSVDPTPRRYGRSGRTSGVLRAIGQAIGMAGLSDRSAVPRDVRRDRRGHNGSSSSRSRSPRRRGPGRGSVQRSRDHRRVDAPPGAVRRGRTGVPHRLGWIGSATTRSPGRPRSTCCPGATPDPASAASAVPDR